ncbi:MAG TPA: aldo/keto reductase [Thermoanaerobaculia bacterium]|nr:aldo/keto reductase [Thermoanaerobaculia bacterium]
MEIERDLLEACTNTRSWSKVCAGRNETMIERPIPKSGETIPAIGLGTWQTFDASEREHPALTAVLTRFAALGGRVIDSSPMYGRAEEVVGALRSAVPQPFLATKVWTRGRKEGIAQMNRSMQLLRATTIDLMQIHNLVDWQTHLATLREWKAEGRVRYIGITHYTVGAFAQLEQIMRSEEIDFVQLPLSVAVPDAATRLLPIAKEYGIAVLVNRPFEEGALVKRKSLPSWAADYGATSWSELLLRWILSHEEVTCVIPATANPEHLEENMRAGEGRLLDARERNALREKILRSA